MSEKELIDILLAGFYENFATTVSNIVVEEDAVECLYSLSVDKISFPLTKQEREKVNFRAAYALEAIYFSHNVIFKKIEKSFYSDFSSITNNSAKRHFAKILAHQLKIHLPEDSVCESLAESVALWATEPKMRVAVVIWCVESLFLLRERVLWVPELLMQIIEILERDSSPAMVVRMKRWRILVQNKLLLSDKNMD